MNFLFFRLVQIGLVCNENYWDVIGWTGDIGNVAPNLTPIH